MRTTARTLALVLLTVAAAAPSALAQPRACDENEHALTVQIPPRVGVGTPWGSWVGWERSADHTTTITQLAVIAGGVTTPLTVPTSEEATFWPAPSVPRRVGDHITIQAVWVQGQGTGSECAGRVAGVVTTTPSMRSLRRYAASVRPAFRAFEKRVEPALASLKSAVAILQNARYDDVATQIDAASRAGIALVPAATAFRDAAAEFTLVMDPITPPPGLEKDHRRLVAGMNRFARAIAVMSDTLAGVSTYGDAVRAGKTLSTLRFGAAITAWADTVKLDYEATGRRAPEWIARMAS